jgi:hypothetical protein|tara:strand:+ start:195 stop:839 length:645 start_codon:yes stop_codon:yes gene_type:complete
MEQDIEIINANTRNEKIKNFFINYKKQLVAILIIIILGLFGFFFYDDYKSGKKKELANKYNLAVIKYNSNQKENIETVFKEIIKAKDKTYSPLAFYFLLDNDLINSNNEINSYFDILIYEADLDEEIKNLTIFKKGLFNSDFANENELLSILNPVIKSESIWKPHALYLMAEYYFSKNQKLKSKEFFDQIISLENISSKLKLKAQKRIRADFSE